MSKVELEFRDVNDEVIDNKTIEIGQNDKLILQLKEDIDITEDVSEMIQSIIYAFENNNIICISPYN